MKISTKFRFQIIYQIMKIVDGKKKKLLVLPKINFCEFLTSVSVIPILSSFFADSANFSNLARKCPFKPGFYYINQFPTDSPTEDMFLSRGVYYSSVQIFDENKKKINVLKVEIYSEQVL
jgi:Protein of unknown function (DUF1091)